VVCDLCSSLADQDPRCVYACPHEAAMRVEFRREFLMS
jgi:Fe-S-cluster-containing hydrogenase component 2